MDRQQAILDALGRHAGPLSRDELQRALGWREPAWKLRRDLQALQAQGLVEGEGRTVARRYRLARARAPAPIAGLDFSDEGAAILASVSRPLHLREPCSYEKSFLSGYRPNATRYLRDEELGVLHSLGATPDADQPAGTYARHVLERLLIDLSWNSSRLEGNTYSLLDTEKLFRDREVPEGRAARETQMLLNHKQAIEFLVDGAADLSLDPRTLRTLHGMLAENLLSNPADEGRLRQMEVRISESVYIPLGVPQLIEEAFYEALETARAIRDPFEQCFFLLVHLPYPQPFSDVNKRTSRLAANLPLLQRNLQPLSFIDVPREAYTLATLGIYEERRVAAMRDVFLWAYRRSAARYRAIRQSLGEPDAFRLRHRDSLRDAVRTVVQELVPPDAVEARLSSLAAALVEPGAREQFQRTARRELDALNEGTYARYRLRPSEFERWVASRDAS